MLMNHSWGLPLGLGQDYIDEILVSGNHCDALEVVFRHFEL